MIEIGANTGSFGMVIFHSTESGRFMPASRDELVDLIDAVKRGVFDKVATGEEDSAAARPAESADVANS